MRLHWLIATSLITTAPGAMATKATTPAEPYKKAAEANQASFITEVVFNKGSSNLTADGRSQLKDIYESAKAQGKVEEVKILAWADADYPNGKKKQLGDDARRLADDRALEIKGYFEDNARGVDTDVHNMAEKPNDIEKLLKTKDERVKRSLARAGFTEPQKAGIPSKASRALVLVIVK